MPAVFQNEAEARAAVIAAHHRLLHLPKAMFLPWLGGPTVALTPDKSVAQLTLKVLLNPRDARQIVGDLTQEARVASLGQVVSGVTLRPLAEAPKKGSFIFVNFRAPIAPPPIRSVAPHSSSSSEARVRRMWEHPLALAAAGILLASGGANLAKNRGWLWSPQDEH